MNFSHERKREGGARRLSFMVLLTFLLTLAVCGGAFDRGGILAGGEAFAAGTTAAMSSGGLSSTKVSSGDGLMSPIEIYYKVTYTKSGKKVSNAFRTVTVKGKKATCDFDKSGVAIHGKISYYEGSARTRFLKMKKIGKYMYAFDEKGHMVTGVQVVMKDYYEGVPYFFEKNGHMNASRSKELQKAMKQFAPYDACLQVLKKYGEVPRKIVKGGNDCIEPPKGYAGCVYGFDAIFRNFSIHGDRNSAGTKGFVYNLMNAA